MANGSVDRTREDTDPGLEGILVQQTLQGRDADDPGRGHDELRLIGQEGGRTSRVWTSKGSRWLRRRASEETR